MLATYIFCLTVGGGLMALSLFGDLFGADADADAGVDLAGADADAGLDADASGGGASDILRILSLRALTYALFGFGAAGAVIHLVLGGAQGLATAAAAAVMGIGSGALVNTAFGYLRRTESGAIASEDRLVGLSGDVVMAVGKGGLGAVRIRSGARRHRVRAALYDPDDPGGALEPGRRVIVVGVRKGIALVAPADMKLLED